MSEKIVGHKTVVDKHGNRKHMPLLESEANKIMAQIDAADKRRVELMPDEQSAIKMAFEAWQRLKELGWNDACYCPKDGSMFKVIEAGSTGIHDCSYSGEWPTGYCLVQSHGDVYPSKPVLFKLIDQQPTETGGAMQ